MSIIDSHNVLWDEALAAKDGPEVGLTSFLIPGREEPIPLMVKFTGVPSGASSVVIKIKQADKKGGSYQEVPGVAITLTADDDMAVGKRASIRFLPPGVTKPWIRLNVSGTVGTGGKMFAAVMREDELPQVAGQYIDKGKVEG